MKPLRALGMPLLAALISLGLMPSMTQAQGNQPRETTPSHQDGDSSGTAPKGMGSSGWSGGTGGSHIGKDSSETTGSAQRESSSDPAAGQPEMATGQDLKGAPKRFPANKTPE